MYKEATVEEYCSKKCPYRAVLNGSLHVCDYLLRAGVARGGTVDECKVGILKPKYRENKELTEEQEKLAKKGKKKLQIAIGKRIYDKTRDNK